MPDKKKKYRVVRVDDKIRESWWYEIEKYKRFLFWRWWGGAEEIDSNWRNQFADVEEAKRIARILESGDQYETRPING